MLPGTVHAQMIKCGRDGCRCARGELHGPYYYRFWRQDGQLRKGYVKRSDVAQVQEMCAAWKQQRRRERRRHDLQEQHGRAMWRELLTLLRELKQHE